jgi:hypothetical protein
MDVNIHINTDIDIEIDTEIKIQSLVRGRTIPPYRPHNHIHPSPSLL